MKHTRIACAIGAALFLALACEPKPISEVSPDEGIQRIRAGHEDKQWEKVISEVNEYRSRYPYSQYASEAELLQADAYFSGNRFPEAVAAYEEFLKKNPSHQSAALASFRIAKSYDGQSPEEIDREQAFAIKALEKYGSFLENFAQSAFVAEAKVRTGVLKRRIADHTAFVARFYWKKDLYQGALSRYLLILEQFPEYDDLRIEARERAVKSYESLADKLDKDPKSDEVSYFKNQTSGDLRKKAKELEAQKK